MAELRQKAKTEQIALNEHSARKITNWLSQIPELDLSRKEIVNWLIQRQSEELSPSDLAGLVSQFYSGEKLLQQLLRKSKTSSRRDESSLPESENQVQEDPETQEE